MQKSIAPKITDRPKVSQLFRSRLRIGDFTAISAALINALPPTRKRCPKTTLKEDTSCSTTLARIGLLGT